MKLAILAVAGLATSASAAHVADLSGVGTTGTLTAVATASSPVAVNEIAFDLNVMAISPSWGSEIQIQIDGPGGFVATAGGGDIAADLTFGWADSSGSYSFAGSLAVAGGAGSYTVSVFESFDDGSVDPDAVFGSGSTITFLPTPGTAALLGLGGVAATRRRR